MNGNRLNGHQFLKEFRMPKYLKEKYSQEISLKDI